MIYLVRTFKFLGPLLANILSWFLCLPALSHLPRVGQGALPLQVVVEDSRLLPWDQHLVRTALRLRGALAALGRPCRGAPGDGQFQVKEEASRVSSPRAYFPLQLPVDVVGQSVWPPG